MKRAEIQQRIAQTAVEMVALGQRAEGTNSMYKSACLLGDNASADKTRQQLHDLLDARLDIEATSMMLARALASASE